MDDQYKKVFETIDSQARVLVGVMCKRIEVLSSQGIENLDIDLFKKLAKELIYEHFRNLKAIINVQLNIGKVEFKTKLKDDKKS